MEMSNRVALVRAPSTGRVGHVARPNSLLMLTAAASPGEGRKASRDPLAVRAYRAFHVESIASSWTREEVLTALACVELLDGITARWARANRGGRVVEIGAPLSTRHARLADAAPLFTSLDDPPRTALRATLFGDAPIHQMTAAACDRAWMRRLAREERPMLVLIPELFVDASAGDVADLLLALAAELPVGAEIAAVFGGDAWPTGIAGDEERVALARSRGTGRAEAPIPRLVWRGRPTKRFGPDDLAVAHFGVEASS